MRNDETPNNSNNFRRAIGGVRFPVRNVRDTDVSWLQAFGKKLMEQRAPRLGQWISDWADRCEFMKAFELPYQERHGVARPRFCEWSDAELADASAVLDVSVHMKPLPVMVGKLLDRLQVLLGVEVRRRQRQMHIAMHTAAIPPGESVVVDGKVYFAMPEPEFNTQGAESE